MPFRSKAQQRFFFAKAGEGDEKFQKMADDWSHMGPKGYIKKLPGRIITDKDRKKADKVTKSFRESAKQIIFGYDDG